MTSDYSWLDRIFHRIAFSTPAVQVTAADIERALYGKRFISLRIEEPIFVTSLPRAGTTLMLEALGRFPGVATYSYRDMPFVMAPLLWETLSRSFRKPAELKERAHGDGMAVGYDSPEAFEEVLWRWFWPSKYGSPGIALWADDEDAGDFREAFVSQMQRIIAVRAGAEGGVRYLSKNNANIGRLGFLRRLFPDARILVPFRQPLDQAASLLRQHLRFLEAHRQDAFARQYMNDIGHLEFGALHRPLRFDGIDELTGRVSPETIDYWLCYWTCAFEHVLRYQDDLILLSYDRWCREGQAGLRKITAGLAMTGTEGEYASLAVHPPTSGHDPQLPADVGLLERADAVHTRLLARSIV